MFELKETENIEFKRESNESLKKELVVFANTYGNEGNRRPLCILV